MILMFIGPSPGCTGGGVKTTRAALIFLLIRYRFQGREEVNVLNRPIPKEIITRTISVILPPPFRCRSLPPFFFWQVVIVSFGEDLAASTILTLHLKEMMVKTIIVKALNEDHKRIPGKVGVTEVVIPKREMAGKIARSLLSPKVMDYIPLAREYAIYEIAPAASFIGKSIAEIQIRKRYNINMPASGEVLMDQITTIQGGDFVVKDSDIFVVIGKEKDIQDLK